MGTAVALIDWALTQIGVTENPAGSNRVRYWDDISMHGLQGQPWCAAFVLAGLKATGTPPVTKSVWVPTIRADYQANHKLHGVADAQPGDQVLYKFGKGHTGILVSIDPTGHTLTAIEGNTSSDNHGSQDNGGGVFLRPRPTSAAWGFGRPDFDPITTGEAMARFPNAVDACRSANGGVWVLGWDGGVGSYGGAPLPPAPFSYPGLPATQRQGDRRFLRIVASNQPGKLYDLLADDGSVYSF